jgi:hypothetical protein
LFNQATLNSGIASLGQISWGSHISHFYNNQDELSEILVPFFKAGLENNEFCVCVTADPLPASVCKETLAQEIKNFDFYLQNQQIEILDYDQWYLIDGNFNYQRILEKWIAKEKKALMKGFKGLRASGNLSWMDKTDWNLLSKYEGEVEGVIDFYNMTAVCSYPLQKCSAREIIDVSGNHKISIMKEKDWIKIESSVRQKEIREKEKYENEFNQKIKEIFHDFINVCYNCKKVRMDNQWVKIEDYIAHKLHVEFSHGICPTCLDLLYPAESE